MQDSGISYLDSLEFTCIFLVFLFDFYARFRAESVSHSLQHDLHYFSDAISKFALTFLYPGSP